MWMPVSHYLGRLAALLGRSERRRAALRRAPWSCDGERSRRRCSRPATRIAWGRLLLSGGPEDAARARELLEQARSSAEALDAAGMYDAPRGNACPLSRQSRS